MIDLFPFSGFTVAVLGLSTEGVATARSLALSGAEVWAWDDDPALRRAAEAAEVTLHALDGCDWRAPVSLVVEHAVAHGDEGAHPVVAQARAAGLEVISDAELLARAQRDAEYVAVASRRAGGRALDMIGHVLRLVGREIEVGGDAARPLLDLHPLDLGGAYVLAMPPGRADLTLSITFDCAVLLDLGRAAWPPFPSAEAALQALRRLFHRQTGPKGAVVGVDDPACRQVMQELKAKAAQIVIPVSGRARTPGGVYVADGVLYDDIAGHAQAITDLPVGGDGAGASDALTAAAAYAAAQVLNLPPHAAMASLRSFFIE